MTFRTSSVLLALGITGAVYLLLGGQINLPEKHPMAQAAPPSSMMETGFSYSTELAAKFGLPAGDAISLQAPLRETLDRVWYGVRSRPARHLSWFSHVFRLQQLNGGRE